MIDPKLERIVLVGNAPLKEDYSALVDGAGMVVRFNNARYFGSGLAGSKTDVLCIANKAHPGRKIAKYQTVKKLAFISHVKAIWFPHYSELNAKQFWFKPISRDRFKQTNYSNWILLRNGLTDKDVLHIGKEQYISARNELKISEVVNLEPSSGYMAIKYIVGHYPAHLYEIFILGFTFSGSDAHPWDEEKAKILTWSDKGLLKII